VNTSLRVAALVLGASVGLGAAAYAAVTPVPATPGALVAAIAAAQPGDTLRLMPGVHRDHVSIDRALVLRGDPGAVIDGGARGSVLEVGASGVVIERLAVRASGRRVITVDAGIRVVQGDGVVLRDLAVSDCLYGVYAERSARLTVERCRMVGRVPPLHEDGEGNGIHLWLCDNARIVHNDISRFVDAIYLSFANDAHVLGNRLHDAGRYGLHTMYCQATVLERNRFERNVAGCAIMFSNHLQVVNNDFHRNRGPRTYGLLLKDCSDGTFHDNRMVDNTVAVFMDNSNRNRLTGNLVQDNGWGLLIFSSSAGNVVAGNAFVNDDYAVSLDMRRTNNRFDDGVRGNYWSDDAPFDLDADGHGDAPYGPVSAFSFLSKQYPDLSVLAKSPAVAALAVAERVVPAMRPSEAVDNRPLLVPPAVHGAGGALGTTGRPRRDAAAAVGFGALALAGLGGLVRAGGSR